MAGEGGFEPPNGGSKGRCLTTWRLPKTRRAYNVGVGAGSSRLEKLPAPVHPVPCPPRIFVLLGAAEEIERRGAVLHGLLDRVPDDRAADRDLFELRIIAAQVVVDRAVVRES